jgi:hypothetical protein
MKKCKFCNNEFDNGRNITISYSNRTTNITTSNTYYIYWCKNCLNSDIDIEYRLFENHLLTTTLISKTFNYEVLLCVDYDLNEVNLFTNIGDLKLSEYYFNVNPVNFYNEITPIFNRLNKLVAFS